MQINEQKEGNVLVVTIDDRLDSATATEFETRLLELIDAGEHRMLLDVTAVDYMNSAGLKALLRAAKQMEPHGGRLVLCGLASNVYTVFELTGFHHLFTIAPDREQGLAAFS
jgi:anti-anti-sigma factor